MTNYNERLDEILKTSHHRIRTRILRDAEIYQSHIAQSEYEAKQALTSLIKELVAEAKPKDYVPEGHEPDACLNHEKYTSACCGCQKQRARVYALGEYQYNLLKALEEV